MSTVSTTDPSEPVAKRNCSRKEVQHPVDLFFSKEQAEVVNKPGIYVAVSTHPTFKMLDSERIKGCMYKIKDADDFRCLMANIYGDADDDTKDSFDLFVLRIEETDGGLVQMFPRGPYWAWAGYGQMRPEDPHYDEIHAIYKQYSADIWDTLKDTWLPKDKTDYSARDLRFEAHQFLNYNHKPWATHLIDWRGINGEAEGNQVLEHSTPYICQRWTGNHEVALRPGGLEYLMTHANAIKIQMPDHATYDAARNAYYTNM